MTNVKTFTDYEKGYLEASIDAEGFLSLTRKRYNDNYISYQLIMGWTNTKKEFLQKIKKILNIPNNISINNYEDKNRNTTYVLHISDAETLVNILSQLKLVIKERQREIFLKLAPLIIRGKLKTAVKLRRERQHIFEKYYWEMKKLNVKGRRECPSCLKEVLEADDER